MRHARSFLLLNVFCFSVSGCEEASRRDPGFPHIGADSPVEIAKTGIDTTITLGAWLASNPKDSVTSAFALGPDDESVCRVAVARSTIGAHSATRFAVFHVLAPAGEQLPADTTRIAEQACRLRTIFVEVVAVDSARAVALADSIATMVAAELGNPMAGSMPSPVDGHAWTNGKTWTRPGTTIVLAISPATRPIGSWKLGMAIYAPGSSIQDGEYFTAAYYDGLRRRRESENLALRDADSAMTWAGVPSIAADLNVMLAELRRSRGESDTLRNPDADSALLRAVRAIRDTAPALDPPRRAAALVAADLVRYAAVPYPPPDCDSPEGRLFMDLQEIIQAPQVVGCARNDAFNRVWLWNAYALDSLGRAGHLAFVRLLRRGFRHDGECADGLEFYNDMIQHGEAALRRGVTDPAVHFYLGIAYKTIFDLAHTDSADYVDRPPRKSEAEAARVRGVDHLRAALGGLRDPFMRREAWEMGARLLIRKHSRPTYFCAHEDY